MSNLEEVFRARRRPGKLPEAAGLSEQSRNYGQKDVFFPEKDWKKRRVCATLFYYID